MSKDIGLNLPTDCVGNDLKEHESGVVQGDGRATGALPLSNGDEGGKKAEDGLDVRLKNGMEQLPRGIDEHLVSLLAPMSVEAEQYRRLRYLLEDLHKAGRLTVVAVTSAAPGDGKTLTAINLAAALGQARDARVLLVEADIRRPSVALSLGLGRSTGPGLVDAIQDSSLPLENVVQRCPGCNLTVLPAGRAPTVPGDMLESERLATLLTEARRQYDHVVLDVPPLLPIADTRVIANVVDGFLIVVAAHRTPRRLLEEALNAVDPAKVIGLVFNQDDYLHAGYHHYYSAYSLPSRGREPGWWRRMLKKGR